MNNDKIRIIKRKWVYIVLIVVVVITAASVHIFYQHSASSPAAPDNTRWQSPIYIANLS